MQCAGCGLINPPSALRCDCGLSLQGVTRRELDKAHHEQMAKPLRRRTLGIALMSLGGLPALVAVVAGSPGAVLALANLPFIAGTILTVRAYSQLRAIRELSRRSELPTAKLLGRSDASGTTTGEAGPGSEDQSGA